jgi:hypothetical protein
MQSDTQLPRRDCVGTLGVGPDNLLPLFLATLINLFFVYVLCIFMEKLNSGLQIYDSAYEF